MRWTVWHQMNDQATPQSYRSRCSGRMIATTVGFPDHLGDNASPHAGQNAVAHLCSWTLGPFTFKVAPSRTSSYVFTDPTNATPQDRHICISYCGNEKTQSSSFGIFCMNDSQYCYFDRTAPTEYFLALKILPIDIIFVVWQGSVIPVGSYV